MVILPRTILRVLGTDTCKILVGRVLHQESMQFREIVLWNLGVEMMLDVIVNPKWSNCLPHQTIADRTAGPV